jgi:hypothetical protein
VALKWTQVGVNPDGTPMFTVESDRENPHIVFTGQHANGTVELPDGTTYDVSPPVIEVDSQEHAGLVMHLIGEMHEDENRSLLARGGFQHECNDLCGVLKRES